MEGLGFEQAASPQGPCSRVSQSLATPVWPETGDRTTACDPEGCPAADGPLPFVGVIDEGGDLPQVLLVIDNNRLGLIDLHGVEDGVEKGQPVDGGRQGLEGKRRRDSDWAVSPPRPRLQGALLKRGHRASKELGTHSAPPRRCQTEVSGFCQRCSRQNSKKPNTNFNLKGS